MAGPDRAGTSFIKLPKGSASAQITDCIAGPAANGKKGDRLAPDAAAVYVYFLPCGHLGIFEMEGQMIRSDQAQH